MPNRIIKESVCTSDNIDKLSWFEEVLFYRLIVNCDDYGRFDGRIAVIKNRLFPLKESVTLKAVEAAINSLASAELVVLYEFEGKPYLHLPTWNNHQQMRAKRSKYPSPDDGTITHDGTCNQMISDDCTCPRNPIQSESNPNTDKMRAKRFTPPTVEEVTAYCRERRNHVDPQAFIDHYTSNGWKVGKNAMKDWKAAVRTWERNDYGGLKQGGGSDDPYAELPWM